MAYAFYLPEKWDNECIIKGQEAKHIAQVLRLKVDEEIILLDGCGRKGRFIIKHITKKEVCAQLVSENFIPRPCSLPIMALAWSKATRRGFFMEKAVELGVHEVWIWQADHSQGRLSTSIREHWQGQCIAAMKQCHNPWLPNIVLLSSIQEVIERSVDFEQKFMPWEVQESVPMLNGAMLGKPGTTLYTIGPEGGFSKDEIKSLTVGNFQPVSLGSRVLRCETAALLCLGLHWWASHLID